MEDLESIKMLGQGSFGRVYLMKHKKTCRLLCTKIIKLKDMPEKEKQACRTEVQLMKTLTHPNIVGYHDSFLYRNCLCITMEYCDGGDLSQRVNMAKGTLLPESKILTWFVQVAMGLHYMHSKRILHRDIKSQNIFILSSGRVVLGDLGVSKVLQRGSDFTSTCIGTPYYMSPEIFKGEPYNHKSDVWAIGCVLYELCTLKHAFDANSLHSLASKVAKGSYPPISSNYGNNLRNLVADLLLTNPRNRPDTEQVLRKQFIKAEVKSIVEGLHEQPSSVHNYDESIKELESQLLDLGLANKEKLHVRGNSARTSTSTPSPPPQKFKDKRETLKKQMRQLEQEEERQIAAEMALTQLRRRNDERRRRSLARSPGGNRSGSGHVDPHRTPPRPSILQRMGLRSPTGSPPSGGGRKSSSSSVRSSHPDSASQDIADLPTARARSGSNPSSPSGSDIRKAAKEELKLATQDGRDAISAPPRAPRASAGPSLPRSPSARSMDAASLLKSGTPPTMERKMKIDLPRLSMPGPPASLSSGEPRSSRSASPQPRGSISNPGSPGSPSSPPGSSRHISSVAHRLSNAGIVAAAQLPALDALSVQDAVAAGIFSTDNDEREFVEYLQAQAAAHEKNDDDEYAVVHTRAKELELELKAAEDRCRALRMLMENKSPGNERSDDREVSSLYLSDVEDDPIGSPYAQSAMPDIQDAPTPKGVLKDRIKFIKSKCVAAVGDAVFQRAYSVLQAMMDDQDGFVEVDGQMYDGADDAQVELALESILGKKNLDLWPLLDQLLLMEVPWKDG
jgi:serine/threonine protein kinase